MEAPTAKTAETVEFSAVNLIGANRMRIKLLFCRNFFGEMGGSFLNRVAALFIDRHDSSHLDRCLYTVVNMTEHANRIGTGS